MPPDRRRVTRQLLTDMNVAQLQVIVNDLHSHIEGNVLCLSIAGASLLMTCTSFNYSG